jgi:hypothetical protein
MDEQLAIMDALPPLTKTVVMMAPVNLELREVAQVLQRFQDDERSAFEIAVYLAQNFPGWRPRW